MPGALIISKMINEKKYFDVYAHELEYPPKWSSSDPIHERISLLDSGTHFVIFALRHTLLFEYATCA
jgi:hypothetical protein